MAAAVTQVRPESSAKLGTSDGDTLARVGGVASLDIGNNGVDTRGSRPRAIGIGHTMSVTPQSKCP
jgi:hypothetical protein